MRLAAISHRTYIDTGLLLDEFNTSVPAIFSAPQQDFSAPLLLKLGKVEQTSLSRNSSRSTLNAFASDVKKKNSDLLKR